MNDTSWKTKFHSSLSSKSIKVLRIFEFLKELKIFQEVQKTENSKEFFMQKKTILFDKKIIFFSDFHTSKTFPPSKVPTKAVFPSPSSLFHRNRFFFFRWLCQNYLTKNHFAFQLMTTHQIHCGKGKQKKTLKGKNVQVDIS